MITARTAGIDPYASVVSIETRFSAVKIIHLR